MGDSEQRLKVESLATEQLVVHVFRVFSGADQEVLFCMLQSDELLNGCRVAAGLEVHASEGVGYRFGHTLCLYPMLEQRRDVARRHQLGPEFLMAARCQENQLSLGGDPAINRIIGCGIARVKRDHHIDAIQPDIRNFANLKSKIGEFSLCGDPLAKVHQPGTPLDADDLGVIPFLLEKSIDREGQITFS